ncbi:PilZ domain-containing protein [Acidobacteriota bacterium]
MGKKKKLRAWKDRKGKRIEEENKVVIEWAQYKDPKRNNKIVALTQNLSVGGTKILTDVNFPIDTIFMITLTLSRSRQIVTVAAEVKWVNPVHDGSLYEVGLELIHELPQTSAIMFKHLHGKDLPMNSEANKGETENKTADPAKKIF